MSTIKETHAVLTTVRDHLNQNEELNLPTLDGVHDLQDALEVSHGVFADIDEALNQTWAGEETTEDVKDLELELEKILGLPTREQPKPPAPAPTPSLEEAVMQEEKEKVIQENPPPSYPLSNMSNPFPEVPTSQEESPDLSNTSQPVLAL